TFKDWSPFVQSKYPNREGEYPNVTSLIYEIDWDGHPYEIRTKLFDPFNPYDKTLIENQNALAGRKVEDHEDFDFDDYKGRKVRINLIHVEKPAKEGGTVTFANIAKVSAMKQATQR